MGDEELKYKDVNINIVPKIDIIKNKSSDIKWSEEKKKNENIIDMMYSPEKNFYMKLDNTNLYLYSIVNDEPLVTIKLPEGNKNLIKIEWIVGNNADLWKEYFIKAGGERIQI
ncbi:hypothetical protein [Miniphocaeibacter halophilus]|uniref:Uncharacterized protein n=1 Tax=Miniphocaeibacter halophilus TaxID=2931922 RepID=A0AC61MQ56_9FIRM|nr:hypothetical protein [Miniphocaeibacter halophilus]QQK07498.1 hypothetical protein JFY71_09370 [Miniphocaeibacter halophilus]